MRCLSGKDLDLDLVIEMKNAAQAQAKSKKIFVVIDRKPSRSGLIAIGALRSEGIRVIIIGDAIIQRGLEEQKEHGKLEDICHCIWKVNGTITTYETLLQISWPFLEERYILIICWIPFLKESR